jgi:succinate dehydrogenase flavin-adding protein (antitoxin of CptAB toxin-antitoxin module)
LENLINKRVIESLNDEQLGQFEQIIDNEPDDTEKIQKFIEKNVPEREQITTSALMEFRDLYLGNS